MELREAALAYAEKYGWHVFPLSPGTKKPLKDSRGVLDATNDPQQIADWWDTNPEYNIGIATGPSGLAVVDFDGTSPAAKALSHRLPTTLTVSTPRGGVHCVYKGTIKSTTAILGPDVDTRGEGGYIVAPPSKVNDRTYAWTNKRQPALMPDLLPEELEKARLRKKDGENQSKSSAYGRSVLEGEASKLALKVEKGSRNSSLFASAVRVFELVKAGEIDEQEARDYLHRATDAWVGNDFTRNEYDKVVQSAWERAEPRPPGDSKEAFEQGEVTHEGGRYLTLEDLENMPPPKWLIPQVLPEGSTLLYGLRGSGKTFIALDMALSLASAGKVVVYCAGEGVSGLRSRTNAWVQAHPTRDPSTGLFVLANNAFPRLVNPSSVERFKYDVREIAQKYGPPDLVVVDTWRRALAPASVNGDEAVAEGFLTLDALRAEHGTHSLVIHHPRKPSKDDPRPPEAGSGSLMDNVDFAWKVWHKEGTQERMMFNQKAKEWDELPPLRLIFSEVSNSLVVQPSVVDLLE